SSDVCSSDLDGFNYSVILQTFFSRRVGLLVVHHAERHMVHLSSKLIGFTHVGLYRRLYAILRMRTFHLQPLVSKRRVEAEPAFLRIATVISRLMNRIAGRTISTYATREVQLKQHFLFHLTETLVARVTENGCHYRLGLFP